MQTPTCSIYSLHLLLSASTVLWKHIAMLPLHIMHITQNVKVLASEYWNNYPDKPANTQSPNRYVTVTTVSEFAAPQSTILQQIMLHQCRLQGESVHHYVADLRGLASFCKFGSLEDEFIGDQMAEHTNNLKIREKLIVAPDNLSLPKAVAMAFQIECATGLAAQLVSPPTSQPALLTQTMSHPCSPLNPSPHSTFLGRTMQDAGTCQCNAPVGIRVPPHPQLELYPALQKDCNATAVGKRITLPRSADVLLPVSHTCCHHPVCSHWQQFIQWAHPACLSGDAQ